MAQLGRMPPVGPTGRWRDIGDPLARALGEPDGLRRVGGPGRIPVSGTVWIMLRPGSCLQPEAGASAGDRPFSVGAQNRKGILPLARTDFMVLRQGFCLRLCERAAKEIRRVVTGMVARIFRGVWIDPAVDREEAEFPGRTISGWATPSDLLDRKPQQKLVVGEGFEPSKGVSPADLQSAPIDHSGILPPRIPFRRGTVSIGRCRHVLSTRRVFSTVRPCLIP